MYYNSESIPRGCTMQIKLNHEGCWITPCDYYYFFNYYINCSSIYKIKTVYKINTIYSYYYMSRRQPKLTTKTKYLFEIYYLLHKYRQVHCCSFGIGCRDNLVVAFYIYQTHKSFKQGLGLKISWSPPFKLFNSEVNKSRSIVTERMIESIKSL